VTIEKGSGFTSVRSAELGVLVEKESAPQGSAHGHNRVGTEKQVAVLAVLSAVLQIVAMLAPEAVMPAQEAAIRIPGGVIFSNHAIAARTAVTARTGAIAASGKSGTKSVFRVIGTSDVTRKIPVARSVDAESPLVRTSGRIGQELAAMTHVVLAILAQVREQTIETNRSKVLGRRVEDPHEAVRGVFKSVDLAARRVAVHASEASGAMLVAVVKVESVASLAKSAGAMAQLRETASALFREIAVAVDSIGLDN
jgi:hypothetical protein